LGWKIPKEGFRKGTEGEWDERREKEGEVYLEVYCIEQL